MRGRRYWAIQAVLIPVFGYKAVCSIMCMTSSMILVNVTAPQDALGKVSSADKPLNLYE